MLRISLFYISIIDVCYIMTAILKFKMADNGRQTNQYPSGDLIADNIFRILSIKNVGKATI